MAIKVGSIVVSAVMAIVAVMLQGCVGNMAQMAGKAASKSISLYCRTDAGRITKQLEVEKSRRVNAMCEKFKTQMHNSVEHSNDHHAGSSSMGVDTSVVIYCYGKAAQIWEEETLALIKEEEDKCVTHLTDKIADFSATKAGEWTEKINSLAEESYNSMKGAHNGIITKFESSMDTALDAVDKTSEGMQSITAGVVAVVGHVAEDACRWVNDDYLLKLEIQFNKSIAKACDAAKEFAGEIGGKTGGSVKHDSDHHGSKAGIDINVAIKFEQDCHDTNAETAEAHLAEQTHQLAKECKDDITGKLKGKTCTVAHLTNLAHVFIQGQKAKLPKIEKDFEHDLKTLHDLQAEFEHHVTKLYAAPSASIVPVSSTGVAAVAGACAAVLAVAGLAVAIRARRRTVQEAGCEDGLTLPGYEQDLMESCAEE